MSVRHAKCKLPYKYVLLLLRAWRSCSSRSKLAMQRKKDDGERLTVPISFVMPPEMSPDTQSSNPSWCEGLR